MIEDFRKGRSETGGPFLLFCPRQSFCYIIDRSANLRDGLTFNATSATCMQSSTIRWVWDSFKATSNLRKHKVSFELAAAALNDPFQLSQMDTDSYEHRFKTLAMVEGVILLVIHTEPELDNSGGSLAGRIISARKATPAERRAYSNG